MPDQVRHDDVAAYQPIGLPLSSCSKRSATTSPRAVRRTLSPSTSATRPRGMKWWGPSCATPLSARMSLMRLSSTLSTVPMWTPSAPITSICSRMSSKPLMTISCCSMRPYARPAALSPPAGCSACASRLVDAPMAAVRTLTDTATVPEAPPSPTHVAIRREDYRPPDWLVPEIRLDFDLSPESTRVRATLSVERNGEHDRPLRLDGDEIRLVSVKLDGTEAGHRM